MKRIAVAQRGVGTLCLTMLLMYFTAQIAMAPPVLELQRCAQTRGGSHYCL